MALLVGIGHFLMVDNDNPWGRFDDVRQGKAILYPPRDQIVMADHPDEVPGVLTEVERATEAG